MASFLSEELGVAMSGVKWDIGNFKLWQSTQPDIILFTPQQPSLAKNPENGRYQMAVSVYREQREGKLEITGGSAIFTITSAVKYDAQAFERLKEQWRSEMGAVGPQPPRNPRFIPLNVRKGRAQVLINPEMGSADEAHNNLDIGTPGGTNSFLLVLKAQAAQGLKKAIETRSHFPVGVQIRHEYLRVLPEVGAKVTVQGRRVFSHLSAQLKQSLKFGFWYGGSAQIDAAWETMTRNGDVRIEFIGIDVLPPELEAIRTELVNTFAEQAKQRMFDSLFQPAPEIDPAEAGETGGIFGGTNFAMKWRRESEAIDLNQEIWFRGWTWLGASMDADATTLFAGLDDSYITEVNTEVAFNAVVGVDDDPQLASVGLSWTPPPTHRSARGASLWSGRGPQDVYRHQREPG